jgi:hypothetical protein
LEVTVLPTIVFCVFGRIHLIYAIWCIGSLKAFGYESIEIMVDNEDERCLFASYWPNVPCNIVSVERSGYPAFSYKPFALAKYLEEFGFQHTGRDIVICDADILWKKDPTALFARFAKGNWVHKITAVDPTDYDIPLAKVRPSYISLRTILHYHRRHGVTVYPNFVLNAGLFMLPEHVFPVVLGKWMGKILSLPSNEMLMSEALLSLTYAEMGIVPKADREDIKHFGRHIEGRTDRPVLLFAEAGSPCDGEFTGYQTATHYFGDQRPALHRDAVDMGLDPDGLVREVERLLSVKRRHDLLRLPGKAMRRLLKR